MKANQLISHTIDIKGILLSGYLDEEGLKKDESKAENKKAIISGGMAKQKDPKKN